MIARRDNPTTKLRRRILAVYCDALIAWSHGEPIDTPKVHDEIDALIDAFAEQAKRRRRGHE
jgi:hypothetical protein